MSATDSGIRQSGPVPRIPASRPLALRTRAPGPALQGLLALTIYLTVFIVGFALPVIASLNVPKVWQIASDSWPKSLVAFSSHLGRYSIENYVGIPLLVTLLLLAVFTRKSRITRLLVITFVVVIVLSLGPNLLIVHKPAFALPWSGLWSLPIARSAEPSRFIVFGFLVLAIVLALWLAAPAAGRLLRAARWGLGGAGARRALRGPAHVLPGGGP